ncbi:type IA DNA topoisomerase [Alkalihalobacillus sp. BA299]|uniref:type IA DNA topoisomerase n=1 Tax=Alkalihalobacillus sp. BA299 TaxID=2815938 RepID=UPI001ADD0A23|nr:type IA DNA topoisomerase [Alkalihalobacillus sp. BA299]
MPSVLIIAEKPSQAERLSLPFGGKKQKDCYIISPCETFPKGARIVWCVGHIMELAEAKEYSEEYAEWKLEHLPIIPNPKFQLNVVSNKKTVFNTIKKYINESTTMEIINAGDPAREGQLLVDEVINVTNFKRKPVKRLWTTSLTAGAVKKAFSNLKDNKEYKSLYDEALSRQHSDWLVGINMSRCASILMQQKGVDRSLGAFSVGRIQTPLLSIIYDREIHIENFKSKPYWDVYADFNINGHTYRGKWFKGETDHIFYKQKAEALMVVIKDKPAYVYSIDSERKDYKPPRFYNLSSLQEEGNKRFKYSPKQTLDIAQSLYEKGYISYPRSSPEVVTEEEASEFPNILEKLASVPLYQSLLPAPIESLMGNKRYVDNEGVDDHHAIIVTDQIPNLSSLSQAESNIYDMIARRVIAAHFPDASFDISSIITVADENFSFLTKGKVVVEEGWKKVIYPSGEEKHEGGQSEESEENNTLPPLQVNESGVVQSTSYKEGKTQSKPQFTLGSLISVMKNAGSTVESSDKEGYKNSDFALGTEATRAGIIEQIQKQKYISVKKNQVYLTSKGRMLIEALKYSNGILTSPLMTGQWEVALSKISKGEKTYGSFIEVTKAMVTKTITETIKSSEQWDFQEMIEESRQEVIVGNCKLCGGPVIDKGSFYGCENYAKTQCGFSISKKIAGKTLTQANVKSILMKGTTPLIKGFKKKNKDDTFDAFLIWDSNQNKLTFSFEGVSPKKKSN